MMMRKLAVLVTLVAIVASLLISGDSKASTADTGIPNNEIASNVNQTHSATLTITMITPPLPDE